MGEAAKKPTSFDISIKNVDRYTLYVALTQVLRCPVCKSGPLDTTDPVKFLKFGKLWNSFGLSSFEDLNNDELIKLLSVTDTSITTLDTDILRYTVETLLTVANNLNAFTPAIPLLNTLMTIATDNNIKIDTYEETETPTLKQVTLTDADLKLFLTVFFSAKRCPGEFNLQNGSTVAHGAPMDHPRTVKEYNLYLKTINQLGLLSAILGQKDFEHYEGEKTFDLDVQSTKYLRDLISQRSTSLSLPAHKLINIFNKLGESEK